MSSILVSFYVDIPKSIIEDVFAEQNIVPFKQKTYKSVFYNELGGIIPRFIVEAGYGPVSEIAANLANQPEVRSVHISDELSGPKRTYRRKSFEDNKKR